MASRYVSLYEQVYHKLLSRSLTVIQSDAPVLRLGRGFMETFDYTLQLAVGCPAGSLFCYVPGGQNSPHGIWRRSGALTCATSSVL